MVYAKNKFILSIGLLANLSFGMTNALADVDCSKANLNWPTTRTEKRNQVKLFKIWTSTAPLQLPAGTTTDQLPVRAYQLDNFASLLGRKPFPTTYAQKKSPVYLSTQRPLKGLIVVTPGSEGVRNLLLGNHIRNFLNAGFAVAVINSFEFRGRTEVLTNQGSITFASQLSDVLWAIRSARESTHYKNLPIGVFGPSRGGQIVQLLWDKRVLRSVLNTLSGPQALATIYPASNLAYAHPQPLNIPYRILGAEIDDKISPKNTKKIFAHMTQPGLKLTWLHAGHLFDAPVKLTFFPQGESIVNVPIVKITDEGTYQLEDKKWNTWAEVGQNVFGPSVTCGSSLGKSDDSVKQSLDTMRSFFVKNVTIPKG